jgi:hypothetical protein
MKFTNASDIFVYSAEAMENNLQTLWLKLAAFLHLSPEDSIHRSLKKYQGVRVNTNGRKGAFNLTRASDVACGGVNGLYPLSGCRPVLNSTLRMLNRYWALHGDCTWASQMTGFAYPACNGKSF